MALVLRVNDVVARTGVRTARFTIPGRELVDGMQLNEKTVMEPARNRFMVLSLPKEVGQYIRLRPDLPSKRYRIGTDARKYVGELLALSKEQIAARTFVVLEIQPPLTLDLFIDVNTDHPAIIAEADSGGAASPPAAGKKNSDRKMRVDAVVVHDNKDRATSQVDDIEILLAPVRNMPAYGGYAALDFGNTSTTLVLSDTDQRDAFEIVPADDRQPEAVKAARPVLTALGITDIRPPVKAGGYQQYTATIGNDAVRTTGASWLVLGAKRLLSDRKPGAAGEEAVVLGNAVHRVPATDPAEVFIMHMMQGLFFHRQSRPQSLAVTCPTTFTASEVARLKRTVARAFHRATDGVAARFREESIESFVPLVIDEASAAAFYFAHRDFIEGPGRTPAFRYLYPNGLQMLIYDCGGGTTDLALVRLESRGSGEVEIRVLGRAGHRSFGGDFITLQVFRLLKAKLAAVKGAIPAFPKNPGQIEKFLEDHKTAIDAAVPTTYDRGQQQNEAAKERYKTALSLWGLAESLKLRLSVKGTKDVKPGVECSRFLGQSSERMDLSEGVEASDVFGGLAITRQEVDALVDPEIDKTIDYANDLVRGGMEALAAEWARGGGEAPLELPEVDRVYVVGNASRYPRILERIVDEEHGLQIRFLEQRLAEVKPEDYKNSVAKGAIVAQRLRDEHAATRVSWDAEFMLRLPFDLEIESHGHAGERVLFRRGQRYSGELVSWREISADPRTGKPTTQRIRVDRRWPGEAKAEPCMLFQFDEPISGRFVIRYDEDRVAFVMHPDRKGGADELLAVAEPFEQSAYLAPPQSGRI